MAKDRGKGKGKSQRSKKLTVKKAPIKDLEARKDKDIKGGVYPPDAAYKTRY